MVVTTDSAFLQAIGDRIRALRMEKGWSQQELCYRVGMEKSNLSVIETGKSNPQLLTICKIACALGVQPREVFQFEVDTDQFMEARGVYAPRKHKK
jgi:transcriptional regulator with XRE-family HTH domain